ncbi:hypothetical protein BDW72DRAFT_207842 [Aspergillus terricola var. indicus]
MEVRLSPQPNDDSFPFEDFIHDPDEIKMNEKGYCFVTSRPVDKALGQSLSAEEYARLASSPELAEDLTSAAYPVKKQWQKFMEYGINVFMQLDVALLRYLGTARGVFRQGPVLASSTRGTGTRLRKTHPCPCAISVWRPVGGSIGPEQGLFKVYPESHHLNTQDELRRSGIQAVDIRIPADQVLFTHGGLWIEERSMDGFLLWMGMSTEIIGLHIDKYSLEFVALAHGASPFLLRHQPPELEITPAPEISQPISRQLGPPSGRSVTAIQILDSASASFPQIIEFIEKLQEPTGLILQRYYTAHDPTVTFLSVGYDTDPETWFLRALVVRYLTKLCRSRGKTIKGFVQEEGLPDAAQNAISNGQKLDWLEQILENPGIWLALMGVFSRLGRLPTRELVSIRTLIYEYQVVLEKASEWSQLVDNCSRLYSTLVLGI